MNREEARSLLAACRPDGADANDLRFTEALARVQRDAELRAWFEAEQAADQVIAAKLRAAPLPENLLEQIRDGTRAQIAGRPRRLALPLAMAACLALLGLIAALWLLRSSPAPPGSFAAYRSDMARLLLTFPKLDLATDRLPEVRQWLSERHALTRFEIPKALERFPSIGCRTVAWEGRQLALVCFMVQGEVVHLFVMPRSAFPDAIVAPTPTLARVGSQNTASWAIAGNLYLVVTKVDETMLRELL